MGFFDKLKQNKAQRIAGHLKAKRERAIKEEGLANLRKKEMAYDKRIAKAQHTAVPQHGAGGSIFGAIDKAQGTVDKTLDSVFGPPQKGRKKQQPPKWGF